MVRKRLLVQRLARFSTRYLHTSESVYAAQTKEVFSSALVDSQQETSANKKWKVVRRPLLDMELRRYAQSPVVPQALILHGPRGVGKRITVEGLLQDWRAPPHAVAYVDLLSQEKTPPWALIQVCPTTSSVSREGKSDLRWIRRNLDEGLESLAIQAVQVGCLKGKNVYDFLVDHHAFDGALSQFLGAQTTGSGGLAAEVSCSGKTKQMWQDALRYMRRIPGIAGHLTNVGASGVINDIILNVLECPDKESLHTILPNEVGRKTVKKQMGPDGQAAMKENAMLALVLAKHLLQIQENSRTSAGSQRRSQGLIPKGLVDAAISWPMLLFQLVSWATQEGLFQPKLVINGLEILRNAPMGIGGLDGAAYHDGLLLQLVNTSITQGSFPVILVSSDSYYSWQLGEDFGSTDTFVYSEVFGWTPKEAAIHLVPGVFSADEWKVVAAVLGPNPRHLVELQSIRHSQAFSERMKEDDSTDIEDCIDLYLSYLQVTVVDPAMEVAMKLLKNFADKAIKGHVDGQLLQHGAPWRNFPKTGDANKQQWARLQLMDFIEALGNAEFGVNYFGGGLELLDDPAAHVLVQVGVLYQQRASPYIRPTSRAILRCLTRWLVNEKLQLSTSDKIRYQWHRLIRGRYYRHLMLES